MRLRLCMRLVNAPNLSSLSFFQCSELIGVSQFSSDGKTSTSGYKHLDKGKPVFHGNYETACSDRLFLSRCG